MMSNIASFAGPSLAGGMTGFGLFGVTASQTMYYFRTYPVDHKFLKALVVMLFIMEGTHTAFLAQGIHHAFILCKLPENVSATLDITWGLAGSIIISLMIPVLVQSFYAWRVYRLSTGHHYQKYLVAFILTTSLLQFGSGLVANVSEYNNPSIYLIATTPLPRISYLVNLIMIIVCDLSISISLVYLLRKMRTSFPTSQSVVDRLVIFSLTTGLLTSIIAICTLMAYYIAPSTSLLYTAFDAVIGAKLYVNSMLATLNSRRKVRQLFSESQAEGMGRPIEGLVSALTSTNSDIDSTQST